LHSLSAVIITYNEEEKVENALRSLKGVVDEIVIVDSGSADKTEEICLRYTDRFMHHDWSGYRNQKQFATDQASFDWVLSLDSDEVLSANLRQELIDWKSKAEESMAGYRIRRKTRFLGQWIRHTTWYPDWQMRLFKRSSGSWQGGRVHESFQVSGITGALDSEIEHYSYSNLSEYLIQLENFSSLAAADLKDRGVNPTWARLTFQPAAVFFNNFILHRGFLDGIPGLAVSALSAISVFFKYLKLRELRDASISRPRDSA